jgi:hypothetical protein
VRNITYENCTHENTSTEHGDCLWFKAAIYIDGFYACEEGEYDPDLAVEKSESTPILENVTLKNVTSRTVAGRGVYICGLPESPIQGLRLIHVRSEGTKPPFVHNAPDAQLTDTDFKVTGE